jgi:F0F1-type ATP synthase assembly protein I
MHINAAARSRARHWRAMTARRALALVLAIALVVWAAAMLTSHTLGGWIHVLPLAVLLAIAVRVVYTLLTLD